jgi:DNA-directed RNA polymerase I and III subunit RPAC1
MAIEDVFIHRNTTAIHDEILAHRLGLIPLLADPRMFEFKAASDPATDLNTIVLKLEVSCKVNSQAHPDETDPAKKYLNSTGIYTLTSLFFPNNMGTCRRSSRKIRKTEN